MSLDSLCTPALLISKEQLERNSRKMLQICEERGLLLRPNVKTHKSVHITEAQFTGKLRVATLEEEEKEQPQAFAVPPRVCTSTLCESRHFLDIGVEDVLYAVPIAGAAKIERAVELNATKRFAVLVDNVEQVSALAAAASSWRVWVKVDCGYGRAGRKPELLGPVVESIKAHGFKLMGFYTHAGHSYKVGSDEALMEVRTMVQQLHQYQGDCCTISFGATPTASRPADPLNYEAGTEIHPGNYVFYDRQQLQIGSCASSGDISVCVLATVIGVYPERGTALIDAGSRALGKDMLEKPTHSTWAEILDHPLMQLNTITQEVGIITGPGATQLRIGQQLLLLPNHSCLTATNFGKYHVVDRFESGSRRLLGSIPACERGFE